MAADARAAVRLARKRLAALANDENAVQMAAYMKTDMPFYGVKKPERVPVFRELRDAFPPADDEAYAALVDALSAEPQREAKYLAIQLAVQHKRFITMTHVPLYERLVVEGAWWDLVDDVAIRLVGTVFLRERDAAQPLLDAYVDHDDMWLRRTAIIAQIKHKADTDEDWLFDVCRRRGHETEFFIRKAIGWALREHAKSRPDAVVRFLRAHRDGLSNLSVREASKHLAL